MSSLDRRLNAYRADLADIRLSGRVEAKRFVEGDAATVAAPLAGVHRAPGETAMMETQALRGEHARVFDGQDGWSWVSLVADGYVGYVRSAALEPGHAKMTHRVCVPLTYMYPEANIKSQPAMPLPMNARVEIEDKDGEFARLVGGGYAIAHHLAWIEEFEADFVAVAEQFQGAPYLWGGKSVGGVDCSGLVQVALAAAGIACPRDSDMQEESAGEAADLAGVRRGDLVFWKGHAGIMLDGRMLLHANGYAMRVAREPLEHAIARIAMTGGPVTAVRRLR